MSTMAVRRLGPGERRPVLDVFAGLSERSRRLRFHGPKPRLAEQELERLVDVGCCGREAVAAVEASTGRAVGIARLVRDDANATTAEVAFAVVDDWHGRGVGRRLLDELVRLARVDGITHFRATVVPGNEPALALLRHAGRVESHAFVDGAIELEVALS